MGRFPPHQHQQHHGAAYGRGGGQYHHPSGSFRGRDGGRGRGRGRGRGGGHFQPHAQHAQQQHAPRPHHHHQPPFYNYQHAPPPHQPYANHPNHPNHPQPPLPPLPPSEDTSNHAPPPPPSYPHAPNQPPLPPNQSPLPGMGMTRYTTHMMLPPPTGHQPPRPMPPSSSYPPPPPPQSYPPHAQQPSTGHRPPPPTYCCHKCGQHGHWIQQCPSRPPHNNHNFHQPPQQQQRPLSMAPPPPQEPSGEWHCEPCEKQFTMESQYHAHVATHVGCPKAPDCSFSASKRVVSAHFQTVHGQYSGNGLKEIDVEGQKFMVLVGNSPEEIAKWREERRKRWPSSKRQETVTTLAADANDSLISRKRKRSEDQDLEDGEIDEEKELTKDQIQAPEQSTTTSSEVSPVLKKQKKDKLCAKFLRNQCRFGPKCHFSHDRSQFACRVLVQQRECKNPHCAFSHDPSVVQLQQAQQQTQANDKILETKWKQEVQGSLLCKLLKPQIAQEHAQLLQVVHFVVENMLPDKN